MPSESPRLDTLVIKLHEDVKPNSYFYHTLQTTISRLYLRFISFVHLPHAPATFDVVYAKLTRLVLSSLDMTTSQLAAILQACKCLQELQFLD